MASVVVFAAAACVLVLLVVGPSVSTAAPVVYSVGDARGWAVPADNGTETYNHWAKRNRFHAGDVLDFKYASNDSVLLVTHDGYKECSTARPESRFTGGDTRFTFGRHGLFFFVSGAPGHCEAGQRMIVRVIAPHSTLADAPAPAPAASGPSLTPLPAAPAGAPSASPAASSPNLSPQAQASGTSRRMLAGFSVVGIFVCAIAVLGAGLNQQV